MDNVEKTIIRLLALSKTNKKEFIEEYKNLPFHVYEDIEALSYSKTKRAIGKNAKKVTAAFHNTFK